MVCRFGLAGKGYSDSAARLPHQEGAVRGRIARQMYQCPAQTGSVSKSNVPKKLVGIALAPFGKSLLMALRSPIDSSAG